jgi:hypothetical protein
LQLLPWWEKNLEQIIMKPLAILALILTAGLNPLAPAIAQADQPSPAISEKAWPEWRSPRGRFRVSLPSPAQESVEVIFPHPALDPKRTFATGVIAYHLSSESCADSSTEPCNCYDIYYFKLDGSDRMSAQEIQDNLDIFTKSIAGVDNIYPWRDIFVSAKDIRTGSIAGKEVSLYFQNEHSYKEASMRTFMVDGWMYFVRGKTFVSERSGYERPSGIPHIRRFLDSFQFNLHSS